jgi:CRP-like cAMP-binding protein
MHYLDLFEGWADIEDFAARAVLFSENEPADHLYVILEGDVELTFHGEPLGIEKRGGIVGEMAIIREGTRNSSATAVTPVRAARLDRNDFKDLIDRDSGFAFHAMSTLANRLRAVDRFISQQIES